MRFTNKKNEKCIFIATTLGGNSVGDFYEGIAEQLVLKGYQVVLITDGNRFELVNHRSNPAIYTWPSKRPTSVRDAIFLLKLIGQYRPNCIIANFGSTNVCMIVGWVKNIRSRIVWHHTPIRQLRMDFSYHWSWLKKAYLHNRKKLVYRLATNFICATDYIANDLKVYYGVPSKAIFKKYFLLPDPLKKIEPQIHDNNKIAFVGRFFPSKGQDCMIRALPMIKKEFPFVNVCFTGTGPTLEFCRSLSEKLGVTENCTFLGRLPEHKQVFKLMAEASIGVGMSQDEGFGLVFIENMSVCTPVIAGDIPPIREYVVDGVNGYLVRPGDHVTLGKRIIALLRDRSLRDEMSLHARKVFLEKFCLEINAVPYSEFFETMIY